MFRNIHGLQQAYLYKPSKSKLIGNVITRFATNSKFVTDLSQYRNAFSDLADDAKFDKLLEFCDLIHVWNSKINVISRKDVDNMVENHLVPSLSVAKVAKLAQQRIIDVGTGGGFPGLPLAILYPETHFTLLDSNGKKMTVVNDVVEQLRLPNVRTVYGRSEDHHDQYDVILGRAVSALPNFLQSTKHLLNKSKLESSPLDPGLIYIKGGEFGAELAKVRIRAFELYSIDQVVPQLQTDKKILVVNHRQLSTIKL